MTLRLRRLDYSMFPVTTWDWKHAQLLVVYNLHVCGVRCGMVCPQMHYFYCNACSYAHNVTALWGCVTVYVADCINEHWLVASVSLVSLVPLFSVSTALMRASSPKQMFHLNTNCCHTWLIWVGHLSASLETQAVPAMTCVHEQLIFSTVVPCSLPAIYYNVSTCKWLCISAYIYMDTNPYKSNYI